MNLGNSILREDKSPFRIKDGYSTVPDLIHIFFPCQWKSLKSFRRRSGEKAMLVLKSKILLKFKELEMQARMPLYCCLLRNFSGGFTKKKFLSENSKSGKFDALMARHVRSMINQVSLHV